MLRPLAISASVLRVRFSLFSSFAMLDTDLLSFGFSIGPRKAHILKTAFALSLKMSLKLASACLKQFVRIFLYFLYFSFEI